VSSTTEKKTEQHLSAVMLQVSKNFLTSFVVTIQPNPAFLAMSFHGPWNSAG